jgi:hypothetical protein
MPWYNSVHIGLLTLIWIVIGYNFKSIARERYYWMLFFITYTITEIASIPVSEYYENNLWLYSVSRPIQFLFVLIYILQALNVPQQQKRLLIVAGTIVGGLLLFTQPLNGFNSLEQVIFGAIITIACALYFNRMILSDNPVALSKTEFWYVASLFVFYAISLCVCGSIDYLMEKDRPLSVRLFYLLIIESYILYVMTSYALLARYPLKKSRRW